MYVAIKELDSCLCIIYLFIFAKTCLCIIAIKKKRKEIMSSGISLLFPLHGLYGRTIQLVLKYVFIYLHKFNLGFFFFLMFLII
jgi:hypothetical protein